MILIAVAFCACGEGDFQGLAETSGGVQSGSYANMLTIDSKLYIISSTDLTTLDLADPANPTEISRIELGMGIESLFHYKGLLYIGSREDLFIYDITNDGIPQELSQTNYETFLGTCGGDPIVANDSIAYITLSTLSNLCGNFIPVNELRLYDITNPTQPRQINAEFMEMPKGVGIDGNWLFVCDDGLKVLDVSNPLQLEMVHHFEGITTFDVITQDGLLLVVGPENLYQFDYTVMDDMKMLSSLQL